MVKILLVRHGAHDLLGRTVAGRMEGVPLNPGGHEQAARLAEQLASLPVQAVYSSPVQRAVETVTPIAERLRLDITFSEALSELDFGEWTGRTLAELMDEPIWQRFNSFRTGTTVPGGERFLDVQARAVGELDRIAGLHPEGLVVVVSHGDVIRAVLTFYLGMPLDHYMRFEISPASVSVVDLNSYGVRVLTMNWTPDGPLLELP
jgi:probable phosphomutase (TIGR03848 family)